MEGLYTETAKCTAPHSWTGFDRRRLGLAAIVCWLGFALCVWLVLQGATGAFDRRGLLAWRTPGTLAFAGSGRAVEAVRDVTALGGVLLRNLFALGAVAALALLHLRRDAVLLTVTVASGWVVNSGMKMLIGRPRPELVPHLTEAGGYSFPSGHSFGAAVVYLGMALAFAALAKRRSVRVTIVVGALALSAAVAWSRVLLGVHYPSDVVAGWLAGTGWALTAYALFDRSAPAINQNVSQAPSGKRAANRSPTRGS